MRKTIISLFVTALAVRALIAYLQMLYGINNGLNIDVYIYGQFNPGMEIYHDFYAYYVPQISSLSNGLIPYRDFAYSYPPLFIYSLYPFYIIGGSHAASIPIWLSDAATAPLIYLLASRFSNSRLGLVAGIAYAFSPFFLLYEGYLWFGSQPMVFFIVLSLYFLVIDRPYWAAITFAISIMFKQEAVFLFPIYLIWYLRGYPKRVLMKALVASSVVITLISLPFIIVAPASYITSVSYVPVASLTHSLDMAASNSAIPSSMAQSLSCETISNTWRSLVCNFGNFTYTDLKLTAPWITIFSAAFINFISLWIFPILVIVTVYNLVRLKSDEAVAFLSGALLLTAFLGVYSFEIHSIYRYYLVPVYVLPLVCSRTRSSMIVAIALPVISLIFPSGETQLLFPVADILAILLLNHTRISLGEDASREKDNMRPSYYPESVRQSLGQDESRSAILAIDPDFKN